MGDIRGKPWRSAGNCGPDCVGITGRFASDYAVPRLGSFCQNGVLWSARSAFPLQCCGRRMTRCRTYRFFLVVLAVLPRTALTATVGFDALAGSTECAAAALVRRTPG